MFPIVGNNSLLLAVVFGFAFGWLLHRGRVADYNTIVGQFLFKDFTVLKVMLTAIIVGGIGVFVLVQVGYAKFHIKPADLLAITLGAGLFGIGMVLYGYCPGTAVAAIGAGSLHALIGAFGMIVGGILYALSFDWISQAILPVWAMGKLQLPQMLGIGAPVFFVLLVLIVIAFFVFLERRNVTET
jgi:uncharacterized protein